MTQQKQHHRGLGALLLVGGAALTYYAVLRPRLLCWGTEGDEATAPLPGDETILHPHVRLTQALTIHAAPEVVWTQLARNAQQGFQEIQITPQQALVVGAFNQSNQLGSTYDVTFAYVLRESAPGQTRVVCRVRLYSYGLAGLAYNVLAEPLYFTRILAQLQYIRALSAANQQPTKVGKTNGRVVVP